ncbi:hypothetical protein L9F63_019338, partial [Diploptera punctata]
TSFMCLWYEGCTNLKSSGAGRGRTGPESIPSDVFCVPLPEGGVHFLGRDVQTTSEKSWDNPYTGRRPGKGKLHDGLVCERREIRSNISSHSEPMRGSRRRDIYPRSGHQALGCATWRTHREALFVATLIAEN